MEEFDTQEMDKLIKLCRIACSESEKKELQAHIAGILKYMELLGEVNTENVAPCHRVQEAHMAAARADEVKDLLPRKKFLANAPAHVGGMIRVPPVIKHTNS